MTRRATIDRVAGRIYNRAIAIFCGFISAGMLLAAVVAWAASGLGAAWMWLLGVVVFGAIARLSWRSRATLSDIDFSG
jgi:hypothetical protein